MDSPSLCPQCQSPLPTGHTGTLCPACLLQLGFESQVDAAEAKTATYRPRFVIPTPEELAARFPQLEILEQIGVGGMGVVYRARQRDLDRIVALKILRSDIELDRNFADRFQREARALARLNHPNIVTVYDFGRQDDLYYFLMEYIDGTNLRQVEQTGQLTPAQALSIVPQVCTALQYAHEQGVVHRDIKPENILVLRDGRVKIADFGLAKLTGKADEGHLTGTWQVMGTPHYMAPEQVERPTSVDHRADIYSLGVVLYEMLTGELPLGRFPLPSRKVQIDVRLDDVVLRALEKEPGRRYQNVTEVQTAVEQIQQTPKGARSSRAPLPSDPEKLREHVLKGVRLASKGLVIVGALELVVAVFLLVIPPVAFIFFLSGMLSIWTGIQLRHCEDYPLTLAGCILCLVPSSPLYLIRFPFAMMATYVLWHERADKGFRPVPWRDSKTRQDIMAIWPMILDRIGRTWKFITSPDAPLIGPTRTFIRNPKVWIGTSTVLWSVLWSMFCVVASLGMLEGLGLLSYGAGPARDWAFICAWLIGGMCWLLGEVILIRHAKRWYSACISQQSMPPCAGPRSALLACMTVSLAAGLLQSAVPWYAHRLQVFDADPAHSGAMLTEMGIFSGLFALTCGLCALLIGWRRLRWVTRFLLLVAAVYPIALIVVINQTPRSAFPGLLTMLHILLAIPALVWGLCGTRRPRASNVRAVEPAPSTSPPLSPPTTATATS